ncbi:MAG: hypothetical protein M3Z64_08330 [Verrucomicrobiota bacterium]|nr:hypothetical protein [Verrucomicrobiota bacterium]
MPAGTVCVSAKASFLYSTLRVDDKQMPRFTFEKFPQAEATLIQHLRQDRDTRGFISITIPQSLHKLMSIHAAWHHQIRQHDINIAFVFLP